VLGIRGCIEKKNKLSPALKRDSVRNSLQRVAIAHLTSQFCKENKIQYKNLI